MSSIALFDRGGFILAFGLLLNRHSAYHLAKGLMDALLGNYLDKHDALNRTAATLVRAGIAAAAAPLLHGRAPS